MERGQFRQVQVVCEFPEEVASGLEEAAGARGGAIGGRATEGHSKN